MKEKTALIVGAADDVGSAISMKFAASGAKVVLVDSDRKNLADLAAKLEAAGSKPEVVVLDPQDPAAVKSAIDAVVKKFDSIDIMVSNIDHNNGLPVSESTLDSWSNSLKNNITPLITFSLNVIPVMKEKKYGRIVYVGSLDYLGKANKSNYCTAKSAVFGMTRSLALELAKDGITVNQILKGDIKTSQDQMPEDVEAKAASRLPVQRRGRPEDIAYVAAYFASEKSKYVTGQNLFVCGGESIYSSMSV